MPQRWHERPADTFAHWSWSTPPPHRGWESPRRPRPRRTHFRRWLPRTVLLGVIGIFLGGSAAVAIVARDLPRPDTLANRAVPESTKITDRTGTTILYEIGDLKRTRVKLADISPHMRHATIAAEDREFYAHHGISLRGIVRAITRARPGRRLQGGSTITQQLAKNALLSPERTFTRKLREQILAILIEQRYTKDEILEMYLNEIPYGSNAYGVEAAARSYFGTTAKDLSLAQAALLSALPKAPTYYSPYGSHRDELLARQHWILDSLVELGSTMTADAEAAKRVDLQFTQRREPILAPHFVFYVRELLEREYGEALVESGGLKVQTTLDMNFQRAAEDAVTTQAPTNRKFGARNAALVALNPKAGDILAMVGSVDYFDTENDGNVNVAVRMRSPGSSFKPIVYAELFRKGFTPNTILADVPIDFAVGGKSYAPKNFDLKYRGPVTVRQALALSLNIPGVEALYLAGVHDAVALARRLGFTTLTDPDRYGLSLVLGGGEVRLLDEAAAYGAFATEGVRYESRAVLKVESARGEVLFDATQEEPRGEEVLEPQIARLVTNILSDNAARSPVFGSASALQLGERPVAAKTGTAQEFRDGWTVGYTPSLVAGVWVGNNDNTPMKREPGVYTAAPIWNAFMRRVLQGTPIERFTPPALTETGTAILDGKIPTLEARVEDATGLTIPASCGIEIGAARKLIEFRSLLAYVRRDNPRGGRPESPEADPQYARWEKGVAAWREKDNLENGNDEKHYVDRLPEATCDSSVLEGRPTIVLRSPRDLTARKSPLKIAVEIEAESPVTKVEFFIGAEKVGERTGTPFEILYRFGASVRGERELRIRATTETGKWNEIRKKLRLNPDLDLPSVQLLLPKSLETIPPSSFPYTVRVRAKDGSGIAAVEAFYSVAGETNLIRLGKATAPAARAKDTYEIFWDTAPAPGEYELRARASDTTGNVAQTNPLSIVIP